MKIGLKIVPETTKESIDEIIDQIDFIEIYAKKFVQYDVLKNYSKPIVVHCEHSADGVNLCDANKTKINKEAIDWSIYLANKFNAKSIIIHPEYASSKSCSVDNLIDFINKHFDERFLIETMPYLINSDSDSRQCLCYDSPELKRVIEKCKIGFCLDLNHSIGSAFHRRKEWKKFIKELINLKPSHFHISDVNIEKGDEIHLNFFCGQIDFASLKPMIPKDAWITIETPPNRKEQIKEIDYLKN